MLKVERFVNELMSSNCYLVWDDTSLRCLVIDPASEKSICEIDFIESHGLILDYILLTHEHTDHTWGVNSLLKKYLPAKVVCSHDCKENLSKAGDAYFQLYYEKNDYHYEVSRVDYIVEELGNHLLWDKKDIKFINTPGHSMGSVCIDINGMLFSGDTIMQAQPYINKRNGDRESYRKSVDLIKNLYNADTIIYPGHKEMFKLKDNIKI